MSATDDKSAAGSAPSATKAAAKPGLSRRRMLGGALATALATVVLRAERQPAKPGPNRWSGKTRWIGHC